MKPGELDITIQRGEDYSLAFNVKVGGVLQDFAGATIAAQVRETLEVSGVLIADFVGTLIDDNNIEITMDDVTTAAIVQAKGFYDVLVTTAALEDKYYLRGKVTFEGSVTEKP